MNIWRFALKRTLKNLPFMLLLAVCAAAIVAVSHGGAVREYPPAGICGGGESEAAQRILAHLQKNGFLVFDEKEEMLASVESGTLDCCVILPEDLAQRMERGEIYGCVRFVESPVSCTPGLYRSHVSAALFREYAPYITARALDEAGVPVEEVLAEYEQMFGDGYAFSFEIVTAQNCAQGDQTENGLLFGAMSLLLFALLLGTGADEHYAALLRRIGMWRTLRAIVLPEMLVRCTLTAAVCAATLGLVSASGQIVAVCAYVLLLGAVSVLLTALLPGEKERCILLAVLLPLSAAVCPVFADLALISPLIGSLRCALPPYWLWLAAQNPVAVLFSGVGALVFACLVWCARQYFGERMRIDGKRKGEQYE